MSEASVVGRRARQGVVVIAAVAAGWMARQWLRYGYPAAAHGDEHDPLLDRFMPAYDVVERHHIAVGAPAATTLEAAQQMEMGQSRVVRSVFAAREWLMGSTRSARPVPAGLLDQMQALGWCVLAHRPGREIVMGAATRPWEANPTFRPVPPAAFAAFAEPAYVKIAWTLRADPVSDRTSIFRTETRAVATDAYARARFRAYWACVSPGIWLIRRLLLCPVKASAERRALHA